MAPPPSSSSPSVSLQNVNPNRERERQQHRAQLATALSEEDDPLAVYHTFVQWTIKNYGEEDPKSGLIELLEDATRQFKDDSVYKTDLRYLKLWSLYARQVDREEAIGIYAYLLDRGIGISYSVLYEEYAALLEQDGRLQEAEKIYKKGISKGARPLERLKNRHKEFQGRSGAKGTASRLPSASPPTAISSKGGVDMGKRTASNGSAAQMRVASSSSSAGPNTGVSFNSTPASRYALMLAPPAPGKRPEKLRFSLPLLFTDDGIEYSIQEARARSMGLLGKVWGPPPPSESSRFSTSSSSSSSSLSVPVHFNDDGSKSTRLMVRRKSLLVGGGAEPTVTINTKEALEDVFGMYNSPEKTLKLPGSKHAPLKKIDPVTPVVAPRLAFSRAQENENVQNAKTPTSAFRPFVDENAAQSRATPSAKFTPFVDAEPQKTPYTTPRSALSLKEVPPPASNIRQNENAPHTANAFKPKSVQDEANVFSKVFMPAQVKPVPLAPLRDVFTDDHGKPIPKPKTAPTHERAKSQHDILTSKPDDPASLPAFAFSTDENVRTPFKVFTRPSENENGNAFTPKTPSAAFTPFQDPKTPAFTPFKDGGPAFKPYVDNQAALAQPNRDFKPTFQAAPVTERPQPTWANAIVEIEDDEEEEGVEEINVPEEEDYEEEDSQLDQYAPPLAPDHLIEEFEEGESFQEVPLGGRFGQFNVMTPITERTFEFTSSTRGGTPNDPRTAQDQGSPRSSSVFIPPQHNEYLAMAAAEKLAAELREDDDNEYDDVEEEEEEEEESDNHLEPLRISTIVPYKDDPEVAIIEEKTGSLSLFDSLTLSANFRPPNPCNPFDPPILTALLNRIPADPALFHFPDQQTKLLEPLQQQAKKSRKTSGNSASGVLDSLSFPVTLAGHRFNILEKIGEGGFGCVFKARDLGMRQGGQDGDDDDDDDDDSEDEDDESVSMVALKIVKPRNLWEYNVLRRLHSVLPAPLRRSVILPHALYAFKDESFLVLNYCAQGMLLNIVNNAVSAGVSQAGACLDELLVMFFSIDLLRLLDAMHNAGFIHGDLKIDNCLLRLEDVEGGASAWSSQYQPSGEGGWSSKGLKVIDFGRAIDLRLFPAGQQFIAEWATDERDCFEVREGRPWTFQTDYFGLAGIIYCMLFGKYIQASSVVMGEGGHYKISTPFKRYWQTDIWSRLFDVLLNPGLLRPNGALPVTDELASLRSEMEVWLQANCNRTSNTLKGLLKKVEVSCYVR